MPLFSFRRGLAAVALVTSESGRIDGDVGVEDEDEEDVVEFSCGLVSPVVVAGAPSERGSGMLGMLTTCVSLPTAAMASKSNARAVSLELEGESDQDAGELREAPARVGERVMAAKADSTGDPLLF